jgi:hypothetical protein
MFDPALNCTYVNSTEQGLQIVPISSTFPFETLGDWHQTTGVLKIRVIDDTIETDEMRFSFTLNNPARDQVPATQTQVQVEIQEGIVFEATPMVLPAGRNVSEYPITVAVASFTVKAIGQSSSWPCDLNTIAVTLESDVTLLQACSPTVTITGLTNMLTDSTDALLLSTYNAGQTAINGSWDQSAGSLQIDLTKFGSSVRTFNFSFVLRNPTAARNALPVLLEGVIRSANATDVRQSTTGNIPGSSVAMENLDASDAALDEYDRLFELHNVSWVKCPENCSNASACNTSSIPHQPVNCSICPPDCRAYHPPAEPTAPSVVAGRAQGHHARRRREDDDVGFVRKTFFTVKRIVQSGSIGTNLATDPCSPITISVSLATSVPIITACPTNVTIAGLKSGSDDVGLSDYVATPYFIDAFPINVTTTTHTPNVTTPTEATQSLSYVRGTWRTSDGSWIMSVAQDTIAGKMYTIQFPLRQRAERSPKGVHEMTIETGGAAGTSIVATGPEDNSDTTRHAIDLPLASDESRPLKVNQLSFVRKYISQSSPFPCDNNTLSVTLTVRDDAVYKACRVNITLSGLTGSQTPDLNLSVAWSSSSSDVMGSWKQSPGELVLPLPFEANEDWRKDWALSFSLVNPNVQPAPTAPTIEANLVDDFDTYETFAGDPSMVRDQRRLSNRWYVCGISQDPVFTQAQAELLARPYVANCSANGTYFNSTSNQTINCTDIPVTLPPNPTPTPVDRWGHSNGFMAVPSVEVPGGDAVDDQYLCGEFSTDRAILSPRFGLPGDRMPLKVRPLDFTTRDIGQSNPYPCAVNTITITLETNVPLLLNSRYIGL